MLVELKENLASTIGVEYELVVIDNSRKEYTSIAVAYNEGAARSTSPYIAFVHEDVRFKTQGWGALALQHMAEDDRIGLIGVIGSKFKSYQVTGHPNSIEEQRFKCGTVNAPPRILKAEDRRREPVVCVDGLFLFSRCSIIGSSPFDVSVVKGFHGYDMDLSLTTHFGGSEVVVAHDISVDHFSRGHRNMDWYLTNRLISRKWSRHLPTISRDVHVTKWELFRLELKTIFWLVGKNRIKNLLKVPLWTVRFLLRPRSLSR